MPSVLLKVEWWSFDERSWWCRALAAVVGASVHEIITHPIDKVLVVDG